MCKADGSSNRLGRIPGYRDRLPEDNSAFKGKTQRFRDVCARCGARRVDAQVGLEETPDAYVAELVDVFRGVRRVLRDDGTVWLNIGDSYAASGMKQTGRNDAGRNFTGGGGNTLGSGNPGKQGMRRLDYGAKPKDLLGIPWRVAFALQADGWYLRSAIVWHKPNPMPESCKDRPTSAYEMVFLLTKQPVYFYDADAIAEPATAYEHTSKYGLNPSRGATPIPGRSDTDKPRTTAGISPPREIRNARNVWAITPKPYKGAHFAIMPPDLAERCIKAGSRSGDTILDPFGGAGTTGLVANRLGRKAVLIELNREYCDMAIRRINDASPLFANVA